MIAGVVLTQTSLSLGYVLMGMLAVRRPTNQHTTAALIVGDLKSIYEMKCALLDKIVNFGTQIVNIFLYRNFDGSKLVRPVFGRHLGFQNGRHMGPIFSNISKRETFGELITS